MESIVITRTWNQNAQVRVDNLSGTVFCGEAGAHTFEIIGQNGTETVQITGTITARALLSNGVTEVINGSLADGKALVTLTGVCYSVPGRIVISIFSEEDGKNICIYCGVGTVFRTTSDQVAYPSAAIPDIQELIDELQEAIDEVPADIAAIEAAGADQIAAVAAKGAEVIGSIPQDYSTLSSDVSDLKSEISVLEGYAHDTIVDGQYVNYGSGSIATFSGLHYVAFPVSQGMKFKYSYTIASPDNRGLAFYDENGAYISGLRTISTEQIVTVPDGAVLCKATVSTEDEILFIDNNAGMESTTDKIYDLIEKNTGSKVLSLSANCFYRNSGSTMPTTAKSFVSPINAFCAKSDCKAGDYFTMNAFYNGHSSALLWAFYDDNGDKISDSGLSGNYTARWEVIQAPEGARYVFFNGRTSSTITEVVFVRGKYIPKVISDLYDLKTVLEPSASSSDVGKFMKVKKIEDGKVTEYEFGEASGSASIDDTAGYGDTDKVWSANKSLSEVDNIKDIFANYATVIEGFDYLNISITEGKYASYASASLVGFAGLNVVEFDVSHVAKFKYIYTVETPDNRGLHFVDKNNNYISGYQTLATVQDITVPSGAVKCYATAANEHQISVYDIYAGDAPVELLKNQATYTDRTSGGITYTWNSNHTKCTVSGERSGTSFDQMAGSSSALPTGMEAGKKYQFKFSAINDKITFTLLLYKDGSNTSNKTITTTQVYQIPSWVTGLVARLQVNGSGTVVNETIDCPEIWTVPEQKSVIDRINDLENAVYTDNTENPLSYIRRDAGLLSIFHTVGCIGDSLASGAAAYKDGNTIKYADNYDFSWGQCLARLTGNTYYNFSKGGLSTRTWLASSYASECFDGNHKCDMYFIGLGQNDKNSSIPVGTTADIDLEDYTQNEDTYCGNFGKIIQMVREQVPKAPIFVFIDPAPPMDDQSYNNVVPGICALFENIWIIDLKTYARQLLTESSQIAGSQLRSGHYSALGYQQIAFIIATYVDWIVRNNISAFSQVEFIQENKEWTT